MADPANTPRAVLNGSDERGRLARPASAERQAGVTEGCFAGRTRLA
jgi:hypothetical protein